MFLFPYSPRWLAQQGRTEEAFQSLLRLHGADANREVVQYEIDEIVTQVSRRRLCLFGRDSTSSLIVFSSFSFTLTDRVGEGERFP